MIEVYRNITEKILEIVSDREINHIELEFNLQKRKALIESLQGEELEDFRECYKNEGLYNIDEKIKVKLNEQILLVKREIGNFKLSEIGNIAYANMNKNNLNIFYKKV